MSQCFPVFNKLLLMFLRVNCNDVITYSYKQSMNVSSATYQRLRTCTGTDHSRHRRLSRLNQSSHTGTLGTNSRHRHALACTDRNECRCNLKNAKNFGTLEPQSFIRNSIISSVNFAFLIYFCHIKVTSE